MIICESCGAVNLFDGATNCKKCHEPLTAGVSASPPSQTNREKTATGEPDSAPALANVGETCDNTTAIAAQGSPAAESPSDFDIKEVDFDSRHDDLTIARPTEPETAEKKEENPVPETIQKELTLYRDDEMQVRMEHTADGPAITLTGKLDYGGTEPDEIEKPESIIPAINENELTVKSAEDQAVTRKIIINPQIEKRSKLEPQIRETIAAAADRPQEEKPPAEKPSPEFLQKLSGEQIKTRAVAFFEGNSIRLSGVKLSNGDRIFVNEKEFELIQKKTSKKPLYFSIGGALLIIALAFVYFLSRTPVNGQIVGTARDQITGQIVPSVNVTIKELSRNAQVSQAGFFVFEKIPEGIYTLESSAYGYQPISDRLTVLKNKTSTINLVFRRPANDILPENPAAVQQPNSTAESKTLPFHLSATPSEAKIYVDGRLVGTGTADTRLSAGKHKISIRYAGYKEYSQTFEVAETGPKSLSITLEKLPAAGPPKTDIEIAVELESESKFDKALEMYQTILRKNPNDVAALLGQARCYRAIGNAEYALSSYLKASKSASDKGDADRQLIALCGVIDINPNYLTALYNRGNIYFNRGDYAAAIADFSKVIEIDSRHLNAHYKLAESYHKSGNYASALEAYEQTLKINFADAKPYAYMAEIYLAMGDIKNTRKYFDKFEKSADISTKNKFSSDPEWLKVKQAVAR